MLTNIDLVSRSKFRTWIWHCDCLENRVNATLFQQTEAWRLVQSACGIDLEGAGGIIEIPEGAWVYIVDTPAEDARFVRVLWDGVLLTMFTRELQSRAVPEGVAHA